MIYVVRHVSLVCKMYMIVTIGIGTKKGSDESVSSPKNKKPKTKC